MDQRVSITNRATQCKLLFEQCPEPIADAWAEEQCAQFKIWASNLGVFARGHTSIDYRLGPLGCHDRKSYRLISQLLDALFENLRIVSQLSRASKLVLEDIITQYGQSSSASSETDDLPEESTPAQRLRHACLEVEDLISRLNMITSTVRRAGARYREEKALGFQDVVELEANETEVAAETENEGKPKRNLELNLTEQFASVMAARINHMFPEAKPWLRARVANAITMRRNYLAYLDREQQRVTQSPDGDFDEYDALSENLSAESSISEYAASNSRPFMPGDTGGIAPSHTGSVGASTISFNWLTGDLRIPRPECFEDVFQCPYCHVLCDVQESYGDRWIKHVMTDLYPYICLYADCETPSTAYPSSHEWVFHMRHEHMPRKWVCYSDAHNEEIFSDEETYTTHIRAVHDPWLSKSQLAALAQTNSRPFGSLFECCPFGCKAEDIQELSSKDTKGSSIDIPKILLKHVGRHLQYLATLSLTWLARKPDLEAEDSDGEHSNRDFLLDPPSVTEFDEDWKENIPENTETTDDPTWESWTFAHPAKTPSRDMEWSLKQGNITLPIYSITSYDSVVLEFRFAFDVLPEEKRKNQVLEPPSHEDLVAQPKPDPTSLPTNFLDPTDSDDGNKIIQMRIIETSERFVDAIKSLKANVEIQAPRPEHEPLEESTATLDDETPNEIKETEPDPPETSAAQERYDTVAGSHPPSTALDDNPATTVDQASADSKVEILVKREFFIPAHEPEDRFVAEVLDTDIDDGKVLEKSTADFVALLKSYASKRGWIRDIWPLERNTSESVLKTIEEMKNTNDRRESGQLRRYFGRLLTGSSLRVWGVLPGSHIYISALCAGLKVILRAFPTGEVVFDLLYAIAEALTLDDLRHFQESAWKVVLERHSRALWGTIVSAMTAILEESRSFKTIFISHLPRFLKEKSEDLRKLKRKLDSDIHEATRIVLLDNLNSEHNKLQAIALNQFYEFFTSQAALGDTHLEPSSILEGLRQDTKPRSANMNRPQPSSVSLAEALAYLSCEEELNAPEADLEAIRKVSARLPQKDQDRFNWVFNSRTFSTWLEANERSFLVINGRLPSIQRRSFLSSVCAELAQLLSQRKSKRLVLSSFVGEHVGASPAWILRSMLATALKWQGEFDREILDDIKGLDLTKTRELTEVFAKLIEELPQETVVFFLIDGLSFYTDASRNEEAMVLLDFLTVLWKNKVPRAPIVKVLLTVPAHLPLQGAGGVLPIQKEVLAVPDNVSPAPLNSSGASKRLAKLLASLGDSDDSDDSDSELL